MTTANTAAPSERMPDTLQGSIDLLKQNVEKTLERADQFVQQQQSVTQTIQQLQQERDAAIAERAQMQARLDRIISRLRLMGMEASRYE